MTHHAPGWSTRELGTTACASVNSDGSSNCEIPCFTDTSLETEGFWMMVAVPMGEEGMANPATNLK